MEYQEITGYLNMSFVWSDSLDRYLLLSCELQGENIIGINRELIQQQLLSFFVQTADGFQIDGYKLKYLNEHPSIPDCSLYEVVNPQKELS